VLPARHDVDPSNPEGPSGNDFRPEGSGGATMSSDERISEAFVARQAIFNRSLSVVGYELLFRAGAENFFMGHDGDQASLRVIESSVNTFGLGGLASGGKVFVNVTRKMLVEGFTTLLPAPVSVIEILGSVTPEPDVVDACLSLKKAGYQIARDDFRSTDQFDPLVKLADILKVDYQAAGPEERKACARCRVAPGVKLLAKKLGVQSEFKEAADLGYSLFQGLFFSKPEMISRRQIPVQKFTYLECVGEIHRAEPDFKKLEEFFRRDLGLSSKLLRYVNSAMVSPPRKVESIRQGISMVGLDQMKRWVSMVAMVAMSEDRPGELIATSLVRARFCEELARQGGLAHQAPELFIVGLFSVLDTLMGRPMLDVLSELPLSDEVKGALLGKAGVLGDLLGMALAYERAEWDLIPYYLDQLKIKHRLPIDVSGISARYRDSVAWANDAFKAAGGDTAESGGSV